MGKHIPNTFAANNYSSKTLNKNNYVGKEADTHETSVQAT